MCLSKPFEWDVRKRPRRLNERGEAGFKGITALTFPVIVTAQMVYTSLNDALMIRARPENHPLTGHLYRIARSRVRCMVA